MTAPAAERTRTLRDSHDLYRFDRSYTAFPDVASALTDEARAAYARDGFIAVENVLTPEQVTQAKANMHDLMHGKDASRVVQPEAEVRDRWDTMTAQEKVDSTRKLYRYLQYSESLTSLAKANPVLDSLLTHLLGEPSFLIQDMALLKPPRIGVEKPWHQDAAYFGWGPPEKIIGVWIALDPATAENGCMHALPGTHNEGPMPHYHLRDCQMRDERVQVERDVLVPLQPGGAMFFSSLLHHGTPPNDSPHRRWAVQWHYAAQSCQEITLQDHARMFFEGDIYAGCRAGSGKTLRDILNP